MARGVLSSEVVSKTARIVRTGISGLTAAIIDLASLVALVELVEMPVGWAAFLASAVGAVVGFTMSKYWAFRDPNPIRTRQIGAYALVALLSAISVAFTVHVLVVIIGMLYLLAKGVAAVLVFAVWSYPAQSRLVFPRPARRRS
jgi:putative flippase GtrA